MGRENSPALYVLLFAVLNGCVAGELSFTDGAAPTPRRNDGGADAAADAQVDTGMPVPDSGTEPDAGPEPDAGTEPDGGVEPDASVDGGMCNGGPVVELARGISVSTVIVNQGVSIPIVSGGSPISNRNAALVADRDALVSVFVNVDAGWNGRNVDVQLEIGNGFDQTKRAFIAGSISGADPTGGVEFTVPASAITESATYAVTLREPDPCNAPAGQPRTPRVPASGYRSLGVEALAGPLRVVIVPIRYNADNSGRVPSLGSNRLATLKARLKAMFPTDERLTFTQHAPHSFEDEIKPSGGGWSALLTECAALRNADNASGNTYYYCAVQPANTVGEYCGSGCVAGLGYVSGASDTYHRASTGIHFGGSSDIDTMVHEVGHNMGLPHAPCGGVDGADPDFPYQNGVIGVYGYDLAAEVFKAPNGHADIMGYCAPRWISDYNYDKIFTRLKVTTGQSILRLKSATATRATRTVVVAPDGALSWGPSVTTDVPIAGEPVSVRYRNAAGTAAQSSGTFMRVPHFAGGTIYIAVPDGQAPVAVEIEGFGSIAW